MNPHNTPSTLPDPARTAAIESRLIEELRRTKKRKRSDQAPEPNQVDTPAPENPKQGTYKGYGRQLARVLHFLSILQLTIDTGLKYELGGLPTNMNAGPPADPKELHLYRVIEDWQAITAKIPGFLDEILDIASDLRLRTDVCRQISRGVESVRSDDCASLKLNIASFILFNHHDPLIPPIISKGPGSKLDRGWNHPVTANLLCPVNLPATPATYDAISNGTIAVTAELLPRFLYPHDHVHDAKDVNKNVLRGYLMVRTAKFIFIGPSCATLAPGETQGRKGNAAIAGIQSMTPRAIAYTAVQLHFTLSSATKWNIKIGNFNYDRFYWNIISLFETDPDGFGKETIEFYNVQLWGETAPMDPQATGTEDGTTSDVTGGFAQAREQSAAKRSRGSE
ncbi:hypothetical protein ONZ45_g10850 [Pleurotus djamor]|nr:hypothetical protein ONZ45_g10850 [Pleurotus djamor]